MSVHTSMSNKPHWNSCGLVVESDSNRSPIAIYTGVSHKGEQGRKISLVYFYKIDNKKVYLYYSHVFQFDEFIPFCECAVILCYS